MIRLSLTFRDLPQPIGVRLIVLDNSKSGSSPMT